jgi:hypothetical protein
MAADHCRASFLHPEPEHTDTRGIGNEQITPARLFAFLSEPFDFESRSRLFCRG